jgi:hypothetical protein
MSRDPALTRSWTRVGAVCGFAAGLAYFSAAFLPLPAVLGYAAAFGFGPLLAIGLTGLYHCLAAERPGPLLQIAVILAIAGGITVLLMLTTQQAIFALLKPAAPSAPPVDEVLKKGLNAVHFGLDVAWDVLISAAAILFGIGMTRHRSFGKVMGGAGIALGSLLLGFNLWYFPTPPANAGSIDWGPFVALWALAVFVQQLRSLGWARARLAGAGAV